MNLKFQYNKISQLQLIKQLAVRQRALPTLKNKESALRLEVKKARDQAFALDQKVKERTAELDAFMKLFVEFDPYIVKIKNVEIKTRKIAGVKTPLLENIEFEIADYNLFKAPSWYPEGIALLKEICQLQIERDFYIRKMQILEQVRKKTTQKVNLYEKVQIPAFEDAILKIKRYLEDEENLSKASQKILKSRFKQESQL
ncbi:MAG TPA: V-type ATP synthase subunit D [Candidatus Cloacimonas acidaminovorans]|jgi:V/A-type H+-transporting ATPase subunit D|nr:V-type ATP synthase subunit D [Candidatus Cloacimonas sp.]OQC72262.1 MAG: V-type ATP synthase subunit D [Candidatus Cloacimonetes bacterium ADurb.Bin003]HPX57897.1 V-type ATP synthase subunit D [Candidatus Cloacimonas acidaminovorans]HQC07867.1 V-type ATP synthase subunit D [Candidatus Cloacimonas acidaminovorans]